MEKVVKKIIKAERKNTTASDTKETEQTEETDVNSYTYEVSEDTDTRTGEKIYLVKVAEKLSRDEYKAVNKYIKSLGGYWSRFKHSFLFRDDPSDKLNVSVMENVKENTFSDDREKEPVISYTITEDQHTKTGDKIWVVKPENNLSKKDFAEVRKKLATLQGFYSSFKKGFIFKYDPTEKLKSA